MYLYVKMVLYIQFNEYKIQNICSFIFCLNLINMNTLKFHVKQIKLYI